MLQPREEASANIMHKIKQILDHSNHTATQNHSLPEGENISQIFLIDTGVNPGVSFNINVFSLQVPESANLTLVISLKLASSSVLFLYLTNIIFFHWHGGNSEHIITSFRNHVILLANVRSCCSVWKVPASGPRQPGWLKQLQETVFKGYQTLGIITLLFSLGIINVCSQAPHSPLQSLHFSLTLFTSISASLSSTIFSLLCIISLTLFFFLVIVHHH